MMRREKGKGIGTNMLRGDNNLGIIYGFGTSVAYCYMS
jgi:hypothetical protein